MMKTVKKYANLVKFEHTIFALPFALIGFFLGIRVNGNSFDHSILIYILLCMVFARNTAMAFNRYLDRYIDAKNPRTLTREIPSGIISSRNALLFTIVNALCFVVVTWFINLLCFMLSPVALIVIMGYSFTKRFTALCHFVLSFGLSIAPMGAWMAVTGIWSWLPFWYSSVVFFWVSGFDIIYSLQDESFDKSEKLYSIPSKLGIRNALYFSRFVHLLCFSFLVFAAIKTNFGYLGWIGVSVFSMLLVRQHLLVKPADLSKVNLAFGTTNGIASVVFAFFVIADLLLR